MQGEVSPARREASLYGALVIAHLLRRALPPY